jgi:hypothetical protein
MAIIETSGNVSIRSAVDLASGAGGMLPEWTWPGNGLTSILLRRLLGTENHHSFPFMWISPIAVPAEEDDFHISISSLWILKTVWSLRYGRHMEAIQNTA